MIFFCLFFFFSKPKNSIVDSILFNLIKLKMSTIKEYYTKLSTRLANYKSLTTINVVLGVLYGLRVLFCLLPLHSYIHPDEFFQFTEPMAVKSAGIRGQLTWEWNEKQPIRSVLFPYLLSGTVFKLIKFLHGNNIICSYLLLVLPRLLFVIMSLSIDCLVYHCCVVAKITRIKEVLVVFASSYLTLVHLNRTLTNSIECWLFACLLLVLFKCIRSRKENNTKLLAFILALGIWNRPTFILFALYPIYYWAAIENHQSRKLLGNFKIIGLRLLNLFAFVKLFSIGLILIDTLFYQNDFIISLVSFFFRVSNFDLFQNIINLY